MSTAGGAGEILRLAEADPRRTVTLATTVVQQAHAERDFVAESVAERAIGIAATHLEDLHGAVRHLRSAINLANRASSAEQAAEARLRLAFALSIRGRPQQGMREIASDRSRSSSRHRPSASCRSASAAVNSWRYPCAIARLDRTRCSHR